MYILTEKEKQEIYKEYEKGCEEIALECEEKGYPSHGSNYELRCAGLWDWLTRGTDLEE